MTWTQIRLLCIDRLLDEEEDWPFSDDEGNPTEADAYRDVDEYIWTPLHFDLNP